MKVYNSRKPLMEGSYAMIPKKVDADLLPIAGLTFRHYQGGQDLPAMFDIFRSTDMEDHEHVLQSLEDIRNKFRRSTNFDPLQDVIIAEVYDQMLAYGRVNWRQVESSAERIYFMAWYIRPEWMGQGLERFYLSCCQERLQQIIRQQDECALDGNKVFNGARLFEAEAMDFQPELARLLEADGFQAVRWGSLMTCPDLLNIPDAAMPVGLETHPVIPEHYRPIWDALLDAFRDHPGFAIPPEEAFIIWQQSSQFQPDLWQVAWDGNQVVGMVLNYITHDPSAPAKPSTAWTEDICVRRPWRRRGLARALLARSMRMFREMGFTQTSLGVDLNNPDGARHFYESMGYRLIHVLTIYHKSVNL